MICERCGTDTVTWRGPLSALTHAECSSCDGINCQRIDEDLDAPDEDHPHTPGLTEGRQRKGGQNSYPSQVAVRPPPPAPMRHQAHTERQPETEHQRYRRLFDEMARNIGREAVNHLKSAYPAALKAVPKVAEVSLTNHIRNDINFRLKPILEAMIAYHEETQRSSDDQS